MPRLQPPKPQEDTSNQQYVTIVGDVLFDSNWDVPEDLRVDGCTPRTDTGLIQLQIGDESFMFSRSGLNIGVPKQKVSAIIDALDDLGFTTELQILETGTNNGSQPEHYTRDDYLILQSKIGPSPYLTKFNPSLTKRYPT